MTTFLVGGDLLADDAECLVNAVNTVGVMGAGLAKQFAVRWPFLLADYKAACARRACRIGRVHLWQMPGVERRWIANLPTKRHWRDPSRYSYVQAGLQDLVVQLRRLGVRSIAIPALGCGLGGLDFERVLPMIETAFAGSGIQVRIYAPAGSRGCREPSR